MRRGNSFFRRHQYKIAAICVLAAVLGIAGAYMYIGSSFDEEPQQVAERETEEIEKTVKKDTSLNKKEEKQEKEKEETAKVSAVVPPKKQIADVKNDAVQTKPAETAAEQQETVETVNNVEPAASTELHFNADTGLLWPVNGAVILDYSMDQTIYFATLDQYKYNPAVIISGNVNDQVKAAANGKITDISNNEVTGCTVTMDLGDGYTAIYGQLKEVPYETGAYLEAGNSLGFVSEPTKYYSLEGSNLYFALEKDGVPVDPVEFFH